ncbi:MAG: protein kinase [Acidobacteriota bacterium]
MIGATIGNYRILGKLGEGGMGTVYKGLDLSLEREVAIKMLRSELTENQALIERFRAEAIALARLNHPHIAILFNFFRHDDNFFMVMEYVRGWTLSAFMKESGPMDHTDALTLTDQMLDGLAHAHQLNIVHRDLKPSNLMMTETGAIKITDFGIARMLGTSRMTRTGGVVGTLEYMSPERIRGQEADARSDLYSVGIVLYEMLTGHAPFRGHSSDYEMMRAHVESPPTPPREWVPNLPEGVERVILHALAKAPEERYQTAHEMRVALRKVGGTIPLPRVNVPPLEPLRQDAPFGLKPKTTPVAATTPLPERELPTPPPSRGEAVQVTQVAPPPIELLTEFEASPVWDTPTEVVSPLIVKERVTEITPPAEISPAPFEAEARITEITPPEEVKVMTTAIFPPSPEDMPEDVDDVPEIETRVTEAAPPPMPPMPEEELQLQPGQTETASTPTTVEPAFEVRNAPSGERSAAVFASVEPLRAKAGSGLTRKHYLIAAAGLALLLIIIFAVLQLRPEQQQAVAPAPSPTPTEASAVASPTPEIAASPTPVAPAIVEATPTAPAKPGQDAAARERERRRREILKTLQQKDNQ